MSSECFHVIFESCPKLMCRVCASDIFSFYKEELEGESVNRVSLLATCQKRSKIDILRSVANDAIESHRNAVEILQSHEGATDAYKRYCQGMIDSHSSMGRYKLDKLRLY
jgi:hypothetical protein